MGAYPEYPDIMRGSSRSSRILAALPGFHRLCQQKIGRTPSIPGILEIRPGGVHRISSAAACLQELGSTPASASSARVHNRVHKKPVCPPRGKDPPPQLRHRPPRCPEPLSGAATPNFVCRGGPGRLDFGNRRFQPNANTVSRRGILTSMVRATGKSGEIGCGVS
jgi:hypothetical protein